MKYSIIFLLILCFQDCGSCKLDKTECEKVYDFEIPFSLSPAIDTFSLGDTIWIESFIDDLLIDKNTGEKVNVKSFNFKIISAVGRIDVFGYGNDLVHVDVLAVNGEFKIIPISTDKSTIKITYKSNENNRILKAGLILKEKGVFQIAFGNFANDLEENVNLLRTTCRQKITLKYNMNNGADNNYYLEENNVNAVTPHEAFRNSGGYNFVVIE